MPRSTSIARRYADAYFALAKDASDIEGWGRQLKGVTETLSRDDVLNVLVNPRLSTAERTKIALDLLEGVSEPARNLARLLVERRRIALLPEIAEHYQQLADRAAGVVRAEVTTAVEIDDRARAAIARALEERFGSKVNTELRTDPSILGGMVVRIGDRVIDDSVRTHLQQLQASLA